ncbi:MAG: hypothetical protein Ct9H90mP16_12440 [Candidatus Poseidoniales archaeon]|nr:MAG: hypothetical protein Ct9H90mP16_12440 [Candidatus Poseidoniales archaeon]
MVGETGIYVTWVTGAIIVPLLDAPVETTMGSLT